MKRNLIGSLSLVALSLLLNTTGAHAQSAAQAYVPFAFSVGTAHLPAGTYRIKRAEYDTNYITISNLNTGATMLSLFQRETPGHVSQKMVFRHVGDQYSLAQIWGPAATPGMTIPATKRERERELEVAAAPSTQNVEIALK
jgi:hypothetical protein